MIQIKNYLGTVLAGELEAYLAESDASMWCLINEYDIRSKAIPNLAYLTGYFETQELAIAHWSNLRSTFSQLPERPQYHLLEDKDWKNAYKQHYRPWSYGGLHWVPDWMKDTYEVPRGEDAIYLDPGMAFGMSDHPSTRLCLLSLVQCRDKWGNELESKAVIDAGCGSGILALSAAKLGFRQVFAFDNDPVAVKISRDNLEKNRLAQKVRIELAELKLALVSRNADLIIANILSGILRENARTLLKSIKSNGYLILSGMFEKELQELKAHYETLAKKVGRAIEIEANILNNWCSLCIHRVGE